MQAVVGSLLASLVLSAGAETRQPLTLAETRKTINAKGGKAAIEALEPKWDALLAAIATGKRAWLEVARELKRHSDAETAVTLTAAVAEGLARAPSNVLAILDGKPFHIDSVCGNGGFGEILVLGKTESTSLFRAQETALSKITSRVLTARRDACLEHIRTAAKVRR